MTASGFAVKMEGKAEAIAVLMKACVATNWRRRVERADFAYSNIKPWYNPRWMFQPRPRGVERVFVGINPAGNPNTPGPVNGLQCGNGRCDHDRLSYYDAEPCDRPYNDWLDARCWPGRGPHHQKRTRRVFKNLYRKRWEQRLRQTSCFNVCPLRTESADDIPDCVWHKSVAWFLEVLENLSPRTIICNGSGKSGKSPWAVIDNCLGIWQQHQFPDSGRAQLRWGTVKNLAEGDTTIIGINQRPSNAALDFLCDLRSRIDIT